MEAEDVVWALIRRGDTALGVEEDGEVAAAKYTEALALESKREGGERRDIRADLLCRRSSARVFIGRPLEALDDAEEAAELCPGNACAHLRRGIALLESGKAVKALGALKKAERLNDLQGDGGLQRWLRIVQAEIKAKEGEEEAVIVGDSTMAEEQITEVAIDGPTPNEEVKGESIDDSGPPKGPATVLPGSDPGEDTPPCEEVSFRWTQTTKSVKLIVCAKEIQADKVHFNFTDTETRLTIRDTTGKSLLFKGQWALYAPVKGCECKALISDDEVELRLPKASLEKWPCLEAETSSTAEGGNKQAEGERVSRQFPSSSRKNRDWDKIERDIESETAKEELSGDAALNKLFQDIYSKSNDDTKRAMQKSFVESNGTVLSTNWSDVGSREVVGEAPSGMEMRKYNTN